MGFTHALPNSYILSPVSCKRAVLRTITCWAEEAWFTAATCRAVCTVQQRMWLVTGVADQFFCSIRTITCPDLFTSRSARSARTAGTKIALRFPRLFVCCCASALITCAIYYVIRYYATAVYSSFWRFAGQATANEGSFVLLRWRKRGR